MRYAIASPRRVSMSGSQWLLMAKHPSALSVGIWLLKRFVTFAARFCCAKNTKRRRQQQQQQQQQRPQWAADGDNDGDCVSSGSGSGSGFRQVVCIQEIHTPTCDCVDKLLLPLAVGSSCWLVELTNRLSN